MLPRLHLFEWEDQPWLPRVFRDFITDQLKYSLNEPMRAPVNLAVARMLDGVIRESGSVRVVDLCSGAGGPFATIGRVLVEELQSPVEVVLTDLYPNADAFRRAEAESAGAVRGHLASVSAFDVPASLEGVRTLFTAFHHFRPADAQRVLSDAVRKRVPIAIFEPLERTVRMALLLAIVSLVRGFTHTPWVEGFTWRRFVFTYVVPLCPAVFAWDGLVSVLRSYTPEEMTALAAGVESDGYRWEAGRFEVQGPYGTMPTVFLVGQPARK